MILYNQALGFTVMSYMLNTSEKRMRLNATSLWKVQQCSLCKTDALYNVLALDSQRCNFQ